MPLTQRLEGAPVADAVRAATAARVRAGAPSRGAPVLVSVHTGEAGAFSVYLGRQRRGAEDLGIRFRDVALGSPPSPEGLFRTLEDLDRDPGVHAVLVEHPLPRPLDFVAALDRLHPAKDADGVSPRSVGLLVARRPIHVPAVALAAQAILRHHQVRISGRRLAVVGRSETVGIPLALLFLMRGEGGDATVTVAHSQSEDLSRALQGAEIVVGCAGRPGLLNRKVVPEGAVVVDVGLTTVPDPTKPSGRRLVGDADAEDLEGWAAAISPVPGGVGPVTVAMLMRNVVDAWDVAGAETS